mgnify:CR=1 FL=1
MSSNDVPGANPSNGDTLGVGCWAEHDDGSLIFVESTEGGRVIYSMFDVSTDPITEYRDAMPEAGFKKAFSVGGTSSDLVWTWHDKSAFPWDRIISLGGRDGIRHSHADDLLTAAARVAKSREVRGAPIDADDYAHFEEVKRSKPARSIMTRIQRAISELRG